MSDYGRFQLCITGPGVLVTDQACLEAKFDADADVDIDDLNRFMLCFSGPSVPGNPNCLN